MSAKRFVIAFVTVVLILLAGGSYFQSASTASAAPSADPLPYLGPEIEISALNNEQHFPAVAYNWKHGEYLVVWHSVWSDGSRSIEARRVSDRGKLLADFTLVKAPNDRAWPSVTYDPDGDRYLVVWLFDVNGNGSNWDVSGRFVPWEGPSPAFPEFTICDWPTHQWEPQVVYARAQKEFLVIWSNQYQNQVLPFYISGRRILADGTFPSTGSDVTIGHPTINRVHPKLAYNLARNEYLVVYDDGLDIFALRLRGDAVELGGGEFKIAGWPDKEIQPAVAACQKADQYLVVWQSLVGSDYDLFARFINGDGTPEIVRTISDFAGNQEQAEVVCDRSGWQYMIAYQEDITTPGISGRLVSSDKTLQPGFQIVEPGLLPGHKEPAVAQGSNNFLVAWEHQRDATIYRDIHGKLITPHVSFLPFASRK